MCMLHKRVKQCRACRKQKTVSVRVVVFCWMNAPPSSEDWGISTCPDRTGTGRNRWGPANLSGEHYFCDECSK